MKRRIILLGPYPPPYGGVAIFTKALFEFTRDRGVTLWATGAHLPPASAVKDLGYKRFGILPALIAGGSKARILDSFYFLVEYPNPIMVLPWVLLKKFLGFRWIKVVHDGSLPSRYAAFGPLRRFLFRLALRSVDEFLVVSDEIAEFLSHQIKIPQPVKTVNALLPIPPSELTAELPRKTEETFERNDYTVVSTGVFIPSYGFDHAAEAVERLRQETGKNIGLILIDGVSARDETYRTGVLQNRDWITVLENAPHPEVLEIFRRSQVFVRGFQHEGYGLSRIEAVWCGIPVICAMGEESRGMLLYEFGDIDALTAHLKQALFERSGSETGRWAAVFQSEAEANLERWLNVLGVA